MQVTLQDLLAVGIPEVEQHPDDPLEDGEEMASPELSEFIICTVVGRYCRGVWREWADKCGFPVKITEAMRDMKSTSLKRASELTQVTSSHAHKL